MLNNLPVIGICGYSGSGKTTLIESILPLLCARGLKVAVVKHDAHGIDVDRPGKDSDRLFRSGADVLLQGLGGARPRRKEQNLKRKQRRLFLTRPQWRETQLKASIQRSAFAWNRTPAYGSEARYKL